TLVITTLCSSGDEIISSSGLYGGTYTLFSQSLARLGITTRFVTDNDPASSEAQITDKTKLIYLETLGTPRLDVPDFEAIAEVAHRHGIPVVCDNTFATPVLCRPFDHGVDIVVHSTTKWIGGHGLSIGGVVWDSGQVEMAARGTRPGASAQ